MPKVNANGFTDEEQAELDQADTEIEQEAAADKTPPPESEPEPEAEETPVAAPQAAEKAKPPAGYVPQQSLHEARQEAKELRDRIGRMEGAWQEAQKRFGQQPQQQQKQTTEIPEWEKDPMGNLRAVNQQLMDELRTMRGQHQQRTQQEQEYAQVQAAHNRYIAYEQEYTRTNPAYTEAKQYLSNHWDKVLTAMGYTDPMARKSMLEFWEGRLAGDAMQGNRNPAEGFFQAASAIGYKPKGAEQEDKLARLKAGQKASASLSATKGPGGSPNGESNLTLEALAEMMVSDPEKADEMWTKMARKGLL